MGGCESLQPRPGKTFELCIDSETTRICEEDIDEVVALLAEGHVAPPRLDVRASREPSQEHSHSQRSKAVGRSKQQVGDKQHEAESPQPSEATSDVLEPEQEASPSLRKIEPDFHPVKRAVGFDVEAVVAELQMQLGVEALSAEALAALEVLLISTALPPISVCRESVKKVDVVMAVAAGEAAPAALPTQGLKVGEERAAEVEGDRCETRVLRQVETWPCRTPQDFALLPSVGTWLSPVPHVQSHGPAAAGGTPRGAPSSAALAAPLRASRQFRSSLARPSRWTRSRRTQSRSRSWPA